MMKVLQKLLLLTAMTVGFSLTATAQQDPKKDPPPKQDPPKIRVEDKKDKDKPKNDRPKNNDNKKPGMAFINRSDEVEVI